MSDECTATRVIIRCTKKLIARRWDWRRLAVVDIYLMSPACRVSRLRPASWVISWIIHSFIHCVCALVVVVVVVCPHLKHHATAVVFLVVSVVLGESMKQDLGLSLGFCFSLVVASLVLGAVNFLLVTRHSISN